MQGSKVNELLRYITYVNELQPLGLEQILAGL